MTAVGTASVATAGRPAARRAAYGSISRDRLWAMRWSYFFLVLFAVMVIYNDLVKTLPGLSTRLP